MKTNRVGVLRTAGFTLVELMIVVSLIGLLAAIALPSMSRARVTAQKRICLSNLRVIDDAKEQWTFEYKKSVGSRARRSEINTFIRGATTPKCPVQGSYRYGPMDTFPTCSVWDHNLFGDYGGEEDEE